MTTKFSDRLHEAYARLGESGQLALYEQHGGGTLGKRPAVHPLNGTKEANPGFALWRRKDGRICWKDHADGADRPGGDLLDFLDAKLGKEASKRELGLNGQSFLPPKKPAPKSNRKSETPEQKRQEAMTLWNGSFPDRPELAAYLKSRAITIDPPPILRWHPEKRMVVAQVMNVDGRFMGIHRTWPPTPRKKGFKAMLAPVAGGAIRLGEIGQDGRLALTEGIETALSVQQATGIPTWSALDASKLKAVKLPESVREVFVFSDSDSHRKGQNTARVLAKRLVQEGRQAHVIFPCDQSSKEPQKLDFNDLLKANPTGDTIRERLALAMDAPNRAKTEQPAKSKGDLPWNPAEIPTEFKLTMDGVFYLKKIRNADFDDVEEVFVSGPLWVSAFTSEMGTGKNWGAVMHWIDMRGGRRQRAIPRRRLHEQGNVLVMELADEGLRIIPGMERQLARYLGLFNPSGHWYSVPKLGWFDDPAGKRMAFVLPDRVFERADTGKEVERVVFQPERHTPTERSIKGEGSLDEWRQRVAEPCIGNPLLLFALCIGFAGPLVKYCRAMDSGGFHYTGRSSGGKTTSAQLAASVWGCGADPSDAPDAAYVQKWNTTANALEGLAAAHNDNLLVLDELGVHVSDAGRVIYNLSGGMGKAAMDSNRNLKATRTWRLMIFSTGEVSIREKIEERGKAAKAGQLIRVLDIPIQDIVQDTKGETPGRFMQALKSACGTWYGTAGPAFMDKLVTHYQDSNGLKDAIAHEMEIASKFEIPENAPQEQARAMRRFALVEVAGKLAVRFGVLPYSLEDVVDATKAAIGAWLSEADTLTDAQRGVKALIEFIGRHPKRFRDANNEFERDRSESLAGYVDKSGKKVTGDALYLFLDDGFRDACGGHNVRDVLRELSDMGALFKNNGNQNKAKYTIEGFKGRMSLIAVKGSILTPVD